MGLIIGGVSASDLILDGSSVSLYVGGSPPVKVWPTILETTLYDDIYGDFRMFESDANFRADWGSSGGSMPYVLRDLLYVRGPRIIKTPGGSIFPGMIVRAGTIISASMSPSGIPYRAEHVFEGPTHLRLGAYAPSVVSGSTETATFAASIATGVEGEYIRFQWSDYSWRDKPITDGVAELTISVTGLFSTVQSGNPIGINYMTYSILDANKNPTGDQVTLQWEGIE